MIEDIFNKIFAPKKPQNKVVLRSLSEQEKVQQAEIIERDSTLHKEAYKVKLQIDSHSADLDKFWFSILGCPLKHSCTEHAVDSEGNEYFLKDGFVYKGEDIGLH